MSSINVRVPRTAQLGLDVLSYFFVLSTRFETDDSASSCQRRRHSVCLVLWWWLDPEITEGERSELSMFV